MIHYQHSGSSEKIKISFLIQKMYYLIYFFFQAIVLFYTTAFDFQTYFLDSRTFVCAGHSETYVIPQNSLLMYVDVTGSAGGSGSFGTPGYGARVQATFNIAPGTVLNIYVGCQSKSKFVSCGFLFELLSI
jgi:hypothetical protein